MVEFLKDIGSLLKYKEPKNVENGFELLEEKSTEKLKLLWLTWKGW